MSNVAFRETIEAPLTLARRFVERFGFNVISIEQFDTWVIDQKMVEDPETDDTKDPRYKEFRSGRSRAKGILNRNGPDCDDGSRFFIKVVTPGKLYELIPYTIAMLDNSAEFASQLSRFLSAKTDKLVKQERRIADLSLYAGDDQQELLEASRVLRASRDGKERVAKEIRERVHQMNAWDTATEKYISQLALKYEEKEEE